MMTPQDPNELPGIPQTAPSPETELARQPAWPVILGSIGLILGGWNTLVILRWMAETAAGPPAASQAATTQAADPEGIRTFNMAIQMALTIWLLWGSLDLVRRRPTAGKSLQGWAITKLLWLGINTVLMMEGLFSAMRQSGPPRGWTPASFAAVALIGFLLGLLPGMILPILTLIWFGRRKIRDEMAAWG